MQMYDETLRLSGNYFFSHLFLTLANYFKISQTKQSIFHLAILHKV